MKTGFYNLLYTSRLESWLFKDTTAKASDTNSFSKQEEPFVYTANCRTSACFRNIAYIHIISSTPKIQAGYSLSYSGLNVLEKK